MINSFDNVQNFGQDNLDAVLKSFNAASKGAQAIALEIADYSKKTIEDGTAAMEKLLSAKSLDKAIELQQGFAKEAYEGFMAKASKLSALYADLAKETYKPYEGLFGKFGAAK